MYQTIIGSTSAVHTSEIPNFSSQCGYTRAPRGVQTSWPVIQLVQAVHGRIHGFSREHTHKQLQGMLRVISYQHSCWSSWCMPLCLTTLL